mgnify:CR=1
MAITTTYEAQRKRQITTMSETGVSEPFRMAGDFDVGVNGVTAGGGTAVLQRCYDATITGASAFRNVKSYTADAEEVGSHGAGLGAWYRWSLTYVGGTVVLELRRKAAS